RGAMKQPGARHARPPVAVRRVGWGVRLNPARLRLEIARRGLTGADLARLAGVSATTVSAATQGRPVSPVTLRKLAVALTRVPVLPGSEDLLMRGEFCEAESAHG